MIKSKYRSIKTPIPVPESTVLLDELNAVESRSMQGQYPIIWDKANNFLVSDRWGNQWIDFTSTIFVTNVGHANKRVQKVLKDVLDQPLLHTYAYAHEKRIQYLRYLIDHTPAQFEKAFLLSAGTEATEAALKLMRLYGRSKTKTKKGIICFEGNWHGRTLGAQMMSGNVQQKEWIGYQDPHIYHLPFPYPWDQDCRQDPESFFMNSINTLIKQKKLTPKTDIAGFMLETFQGWGAIFYPQPFVQAIERFCREHDILLCFDEMQAGFGRTGTLFGYMHYEVEPDLLCCGKGMSSSMPLSCVLGSQTVMDLPDVGSMSSTHSANPLSCAAGLATMEALIEDQILEKSAVLSDLLFKRLNKLQLTFPELIHSIQGKGMVAALIFHQNSSCNGSDIAKNVCYDCLRNGLLVVCTNRESIKLAPPLTISKDALEEGLDVLEESIKNNSI